MNISNIQKLINEDGVIFLSYGGFLSQELISAMTESLEKEAIVNGIKIGISNNIFTIFIELSQNMMNYAKSHTNDENSKFGLIVVSKDKDGNYFILSQNIVSKEDKDYIDGILAPIVNSDKDTIKKEYKKLRKNGTNLHSKGAGIGFYEIAKRCDKIEYEFETLNDDKIYFYVKTSINVNK